MPFDVAALIQNAVTQSPLLLSEMPLYQRTLAAPVTFAGVGIHSGAKVTMRLLPAMPYSGIAFVRTDVAENNIIPARYDTVCDTRLNTMLTNSAGVKVGTVEHVMSALAGLGIDNVTIEVDGVEVPVADGSAAPFIDALQAVGTVAQAAPRRALQILREVTVVDGEKSATLKPAAHASFNVTIRYSNAVIGTQSYDFDLTPAAYAAEIAAARTFGLAHEVEALHKMGLAKGGSLDNAVVVTETGVANPEGLRFADEFARHKVLDAVGDLSLAGGMVLGRFEGVMSGHAMNNKLLHAVFASEGNYRWIELPVATMAPTALYMGNPYPQPHAANAI